MAMTARKAKPIEWHDEFRDLVVGPACVASVARTTSGLNITISRSYIESLWSARVVMGNAVVRFELGIMSVSDAKRACVAILIKSFSRHVRSLGGSL